MVIGVRRAAEVADPEETAAARKVMHVELA
jgi:hypothetical protein